MSSKNNQIIIQITIHYPKLVSSQCLQLPDIVVTRLSHSPHMPSQSAPDVHTHPKFCSHNIPLETPRWPQHMVPAIPPSSSLGPWHKQAQQRASGGRFSWSSGRTCPGIGLPGSDAGATVGMLAIEQGTVVAHETFNNTVLTCFNIGLFTSDLMNQWFVWRAISIATINHHG